MVTTRSGLRTNTRFLYSGPSVPKGKTYACVSDCLRDVYKTCPNDRYRSFLATFTYDYSFVYADGWMEEWTFRETAMFLTNSENPRVYMPVYEMLVCPKYSLDCKLNKRAYTVMVKVLKAQLLKAVPSLTEVGRF